MPLTLANAVDIGDASGHPPHPSSLNGLCEFLVSGRELAYVRLLVLVLPNRLGDSLLPDLLRERDEIIAHRWHDEHPSHSRNEDDEAHGGQKRRRKNAKHERLECDHKGHSSFQPISVGMG